MDEFNKIRKAYFTNGESVNKIAKKFHRSWETINNIISMEREEIENRGKRPNRKGKVITQEVIKAAEEYLKEEEMKFVKKKQRYTAKKIYEDLTKSGVYQGSKRRMEDLIKRLREKRDQSKKKSYLPLDFPLGSALQVDHGEVDVIIDGNRFTGYLFVAVVPGKVLRYCQIFPTKAQEAWGEFHERAFRYFGGVFPRVVYDNDSALVKKIIGNEKHQTSFSLSLEEHFGIESHFCNVAAGNEKGAVENGVGYCRRNFLAGCPSFCSWNEANQYLETQCNQNIFESKHYKTKEPLCSIFKELGEKLNFLPPKRSWKKSLDCRVDSCQLIRIDHHKYSVPEKYVGSYVRVFLEVFRVQVFKDEELIAEHQRQYGDSDSLNIDHYLDQLKYKSTALWDCKAVRNYQFDDRYLEIYNRLSGKFLRKEANQHFVKILLLRRQYSEKELLKAIDLSLKYGAIDHSAVEIFLRQINEQKQDYDLEAMKKELKTCHIFSWKFDLSAYAKLCKEAL